MLILDFNIIRNRLYYARKKMGLTQAEVAEFAEISTRAYADIERGSVNMRIETFLKICRVLHITPDEVLTVEEQTIDLKEELLFMRLNDISPKDKETALQLLSVYLKSLN